MTIPPWSSKIQSYLSREWNRIQNGLEQGVDESFLRILVSMLFKDELEDGKYTEDDFIKEIGRRRGAETSGEEAYTEQMMYEDEA